MIMNCKISKTLCTTKLNCGQVKPVNRQVSPHSNNEVDNMNNSLGILTHNRGTTLEWPQRQLYGWRPVESATKRSSNHQQLHSILLLCDRPFSVIAANFPKAIAQYPETEKI